MARERAEVAEAFGRLEWWSMPVSFVAAIVGLLAIFRSWAVIVADVGIQLERHQALRIYGIGQIGKYLPGSVWSIVTQAQMVREYGGSRVRMASASLVALVVSVAVALGVGCLLLPFSGAEAERRLLYVPFVAVGFVVLLVPAVLNALVSVANRVLGRAAVDHAYSGRAIMTSAAWAVVANLAFGAQVLAVSHNVAGGLHGYLLAICAYALAAGLGVVVVIAPAGAGVRELVITLVLAPSSTVGAALTVALVARVVATLADLALALTQFIARAGTSNGRCHPVFVSRRFPPSVGGMETLAAGVWRSMLAVRPDAVLIAHRGSNAGLLWWVPLAWLRVAWLLLRGRAEFVLAGDAPTFAVIEPLLRLGRVRRATMILGLDVTHDSPVYRRLVLGALRRAPQVIAISAATRERALAVGVAPERTCVLRLGVDVPALAADDRESAQLWLRQRLGVSATDVVLLTLGRLVKRKGSHWFVQQVLPLLPDSVHYAVAGDGPERERIAEAARTAGVSGRVHLLGRVSDHERESCLRGCDLFVQPNIPVEGDMEGFGLVLVEAAMRGAPVVAADLEGMKDAVVPGRTGFLVAPGDPVAWRTEITRLVADRDALRMTGLRFRASAVDFFSEAAMGDALTQLLGMAGRRDHER